MRGDVAVDEALLGRLPLPLAQLYRRAHNAKTVRDRHDTAYCLWEASLKLLGSAAVVTGAELGLHRPELVERLRNLARPSLGHWWEFARELTPLLAETGDAGFVAAGALLFGGPRHDLPHCAGLDAVLCEALDGKAGARATVQVRELFDRLVRYRNREIGHGAPGQKAAAFYERIGRALLAALPELLGRLDVLAGRRLVWVAEVRRRGDGSWLVERGDLTRENYQRLVSLEFAADQADKLPRPERLYLQLPATDPDGGPLHALHPLVVFEPDTNEVLFLNARRKQRRAEYLCYSTGRVLERADLADEHRELLRRVLDVPVGEADANAWAARSQAEDPDGDAAEAAPDVVRRLGDYELLSKLGQGGMGAVYRAGQPSLGRQVALKVLLRSGDPKAEARFRREIQALGQVEHPHLVKIFTSGSAGEQWFYAMELVEGTTLADVCAHLTAPGSRPDTLDDAAWRAAVQTVAEQTRQAERPLSDATAETGEETDRPEDKPPDQPPAPRPAPQATASYVRQVVEMVRQTAEAAHALHERGVIHRDIKPGNVMVGPAGDFAVLMDLGLAQVSDEIDGRLTKTRQFVGTLRYASPEQVLAVARLDRRSDVYSLGATLWELLALRPLYGATDATPTPQLMMQIQQDDPGRLRRHQPAVPHDLEAIVGKCLEKKPEQRYATARELARDLGDFLAGKPVRARPVGSLGRTWRWVKRRPLLAGLTAALLLVTVLGVAGVVWKYLDAERQKGIALGKEKEARQEAEKATRASDFLMSIFELSDAHGRRGTMTARQILDDAEERIPQEFANQPELRAELLSRIDTIYAKITANAPLAMILEARGTVRLDSIRNSNQRALPQTLLYSTDRLSLGDDGHVRLVVLSDLHQERLRPGTMVRICRKGCEEVVAGYAIGEPNNGILMTFVRLPKGTFYMGWDGEKKGVKTEIKEDFEIAVHDVTQGQWQAIMGNNPSFFSRFGGGRNEVADISDEELKLFPVESVSWEDAREFIKKLNEKERNREGFYRLPTEAEWEYACRGGATSEEECSYHFYFEKPTNDLSSEQANFNGSMPDGKAPKGRYLRRTTRVGAYPSNKLGLCDMHGNVSQSCAYSYSFERGRYRLSRGGSWSTHGVYCRSALDNMSEPGNHIPSIGFRLARSSRPVAGSASESERPRSPQRRPAGGDGASGDAGR